MRYERLSFLTIILIENDEAKNMDVQNLLTAFANAIAKKKNRFK